MSIIYNAKGAILEDQYYDVGRLFSGKLRLKDFNQVRVRIARKVLATSRNIKMLQKFWSCFSAWCQGLGVSEEVGMSLLVDNNGGCQTLLVRFKTGVGLLHSEEDFDNEETRLVEPQVVCFNDQGRELKSLVYSDLFPGSGLFGWQKGMMTAVDTLYLKEEGIEDIQRPMLANIISWWVWQLRPDEAKSGLIMEKIKDWGTMVDGYAINVARKNGNNIDGYKITFARNDYEVEDLPQDLGGRLKQVNIIDPEYLKEKKPIAKWHEAPEKYEDNYEGYLLRLKLIDEHLNKYKLWLSEPFGKNDHKKIQQQIMKIIFEDLKDNYVGEWMEAMCVGILDINSQSVSIKLNNDSGPDNVDLMEF